MKGILALPLLHPSLDIRQRLRFPSGGGEIASIRSGKWIQTAADFVAGEKSGLADLDNGGGGLALDRASQHGSYLSPTFRTPFPFNALALNWDAEIPEGTSLDLALRSSADGSTWSGWIAVTETGDVKTETSSRYGQLVTTQGDFVQWRAQFHGFLTVTPLLRSVTAVYVDSPPVPIASEAANIPLDLFEPSSVAAPAIISRAGWGCPQASYSPSWPPVYRRFEKIVVHHTASPNEYDDGAWVVRTIWNIHAIDWQWGDIGYNYLIDRFGNIYEGRFGGDDVWAGHAGCYNPGSCGIAIIGNFDVGSVPPAAQDALVRLMAWVAYRRDIHPLRDSFFVDRTVSNICGHRDLTGTCIGPTACPGSDLHNRLYYTSPNLREQTFRAFPKYLEEWLSHNTPSSMRLGETVGVDLSIMNRGWLTWVATQQYPVRVGYHWYRPDGSQYVQDQADDRRTYLPSNVEYNQWVDVRAQVTAPRAAGTYTLKWDLVHEGVKWFAQEGAPTKDVTVNVVGPTLSVAQTSLYFLADASTNPAPQTIGVQNTGGGTLSWSAAVNQSWCTLSPATGQAPGSVRVSVNKSGLSPGTYTTTVTVSSGDALNSPRTVNVTFKYSSTPLTRRFLPQVQKG